MLIRLSGALLALAAGAVLAQSTTTTVNVPQTITVTVTPTTVTIQPGGAVIPVPGTTPPIPPSTCARPPASTGTGLYVACGRLNNPDASEFRLRAVNRAHYDSNSAAGMAKAGWNAARVFVSVQWGSNWPAQATIMQTQHIANKQIAIPTFAGDASGATSCSNNNAILTNAVNTWVANASVWLPLQKQSVINIANEWGPGNSTVWRDQYIAAIKAIRAAGYTSPLLIDTGGCGQDQADLLTYAPAVEAADPQANVVFSFHVYGGMANQAALQTYASKLAALSKANPSLAFVFAEFGPGKNIGPSPTVITPDQVIQTAEANGIGWAAWAWDDNNLAGCASNDQWFSMTKLCGQYTQASDLTAFGNDVVLTQLPKYPPVPAKVF